ncbi:MAG TPA: hypothetical protein VNG51_27435 [Ktedonobacteraceae bacterium]|nr:hypothetical protein [Ktedonobacteraceae bacterium]
MSHAEFVTSTTGNARKEREDGRPRGATHHIRTAPVPTMYDENLRRGIVGTGVGWM